MFRLVNVDGRAALDVDGSWFDLAAVSGDEALADPMVAIARFEELHAFAAGCVEATKANGSIADTTLAAPVPRPRQVFAIGLNYVEHAEEAGFEAPPAPLTFTKFPSSIAGPTAEVPITSGMVDWEVEIVAVIGKPCWRVSQADAWSYIAGLTLGQDISDRGVQLTGNPPQFSLGKSFPAFSPIGPAIVSVDSFDDPDDIALRCEVSGEKMQDSRSSKMIFSIPRLIAFLSSICHLEPGDIIFTGTPDGIGMMRNRYLREGDVLVSTAEVIGELSNTFIAGTGAATP